MSGGCTLIRDQLRLYTTRDTRGVHSWFMGLAVSQRCGGTPREQTSESGGGEGKYPYTTGFNTSEIIQTSESGGVRLFVHRVPGTHVLLYNGSDVGGETVCSVRRRAARVRRVPKSLMRMCVK